MDSGFESKCTSSIQMGCFESGFIVPIRVNRNLGSQNSLVRPYPKLWPIEVDEIIIIV